MLTEDPPVPYDLISAKLGIPVGSIGPSRGRCLEKLRHDAAIAALIRAEAASATGSCPISIRKAPLLARNWLVAS